jgi:hypothetical protein
LLEILRGLGAIVISMSVKAINGVVTDGADGIYVAWGRFEW